MQHACDSSKICRFRQAGGAWQHLADCWYSDGYPGQWFAKVHTLDMFTCTILQLLVRTFGSLMYIYLYLSSTWIIVRYYTLVAYSRYLGIYARDDVPICMYKRVPAGPI
jgi:hypothetical protein